MASHQQLLYHVVFSVKERRTLLRDDQIRENTWAYMAGICRNLGGFGLKIGGYYDHAHLLVQIPAKLKVSDFVGAVKANTSKWINEAGILRFKFHWQDGYGAFTVSPSQKLRVAAYIENQLIHHRDQTFKQEYLRLLELNEVEYDIRYIWD